MAISRAEMLTRMGALEHQAEQTWTSHPVMFWEMQSVTCDALENLRRNLLIEATAELQWRQTQSREHLQEYKQCVQRHFSEVQQQVHVQQVARREEVEILRHELSRSLAEGSHYQNLFTTSRSGASESSSDIQQLRQERDHLNARS